MEASDVVVVRHGATEWSASGRHTGRTDVPLTDEGRDRALAIRDRLRDRQFALVLTSPLQRTRETAALCGFGERAEIDDDLREWDYGDYEGRTTDEIREQWPGWTVWSGGCPNGETVEEVGARADRVIARVVAAGGPVALFGHGHQLRILTARWLRLPAVDGRLFALATASLGVLGHERDARVIDRWNV